MQKARSKYMRHSVNWQNLRPLTVEDCPDAISFSNLTLLLKNFQQGDNNNRPKLQVFLFRYDDEHDLFQALNELLQSFSGLRL
jgi:hypothetical protein